MEFQFFLNNTLIKSEPLGWNDTEVNLKRDENLHGVFSSYVLKLRFIGDGYQIIKGIFDSTGFESDIIFLAQYRVEFGNWTNYIIGNLDLTSIVFDDFSSDTNSLYSSNFLYCEVALLPSGIETLFRNRRDIPIDLGADLDLDKQLTLSNKTGFGGTNGYVLGLHSKEILFTHIFGFDTDNGDDPYRIDVIFDAGFVFDAIAFAKLPFVTLRNEQNEIIDPEYLLDADAINFTPNLVSKFGGNYTLKVRLKGFVRTGLENLRFNAFSRIVLAYGANANSNVTNLFTSGTISSPDATRTDNFDLILTFNFDLQIGEGVWLYWKMYGDFNILGIVWEITHELAEMTLTNNSVAPSSWAKTWLVHEALATQLESITSKNNVLYSDFFGRTDSLPRVYELNGEGSKLALTNGFMLRAINYIKNPKISFKDCYDSLNAIYNLGIGIEVIDNEEVIRIERKSYFFQNEVSHRFDYVPKIMMSFEKSYIFNEVEIGYETFEFDTLKSLDDVHSTRNYYNKIKKIRNKITQKSKIIASSYSLELTRRLQYEGKPENGSDYDDNIFAICLGNKFKVLITEIVNSTTINCQAISQSSISQIVISGMGANNGTYSVSSIPYFSGIKTTLILSTPLPIQSFIPTVNSYASGTFTNGYGTERTENFSLVDNVIGADSYYNLRITPQRNILRWSSILNVPLYNDLTQKWLFADAKCNFIAATNLQNGGETEILGTNISESGEYLANTLFQNLFKPISITFETILNIQEYEKIKANPYLLIEVSDNNDGFFKGYLLSLFYKHSEELAKVKLLLKI